MKGLLTWLRRLFRPDPPLSQEEVDKLVETHVLEHMAYLTKAREKAASLAASLAKPPQTDDSLERIKLQHAKEVPDTTDASGSYIHLPNHSMSPELKQWVYGSKDGPTPEQQTAWDLEHQHAYQRMQNGESMQRFRADSNHHDTTPS